MNEGVFGNYKELQNLAKLKQERLSESINDAVAHVTLSGIDQTSDQNHLVELKALLTNEETKKQIAEGLVTRLSRKMANEVLSTQNIDSIVTESEKTLRLLRQSGVPDEQLNRYQIALAYKLVGEFGYLSGTANMYTTQERFRQALDHAEKIGINKDIVTKQAIDLICNKVPGGKSVANEKFRVYLELISDFSGKSTTSIHSELLQTEPIDQVDVRIFPERVFLLYRLSDGLQIAPDQVSARARQVAIDTINQIQAKIDNGDWSKSLIRRVLQVVIHKAQSLVKEGRDPDLWTKVASKANKMLPNLRAAQLNLKPTA